MAEPGTHQGQTEDSDKRPSEAVDGGWSSKAQTKKTKSRFELLVWLCRALQQRFSAALKSTDLAVQRLHQLLSTSAGQYALLGNIEYCSYALHHLLASGLLRKLQARLARTVRQKRLRHTKAEINSFPESAVSPPSSALLSLATLLSDTRYTLRLLALSSLWKQSSKIPRYAPECLGAYALEVSLVVTGTVYQLLENIAYLGSKGVIPRRWIERWAKIESWYIWSIRALLVHIALQVMKLCQQQLLRKRDTEITSSCNVGPQVDESSTAAKTGDMQQIKTAVWKKQLVSYSIWFLLCLHWSWPVGVRIPESATGGLSFLAEFCGLHGLWHDNPMQN